MSSNFNQLGNVGLRQDEYMPAQAQVYGISLEDGEDMGYSMPATICPEEKLWRAVLAQTIKDCLLELSDVPEGIYLEQTKEIKTSACRYIFNGTDKICSKEKNKELTDFERVCYLAGLENPTLIKGKILEYITNPEIEKNSHRAYSKQ